MLENYHGKNLRNSIGNVWRNLAKRFGGAKIASPELDARILVGHALNLDQLQLAIGEKRLLGQKELENIENLAQRRLQNEPIARILGRKEFYGLEFLLNEATLIPRPETELLVDIAMDFLTGKPAPKILELGVGSGCVVISILKNLHEARAWGVDVVAKALEMARLNARFNGVDERIDWLCGSWFEPLAGDKKFDLIVSNPPYIDTKTIPALPPEVRSFEPLEALDGGMSGLVAYEHIAAHARSRLLQNGILLFEIGHDQSESVARICKKAGFCDVKSYPDLAGHIRAIRARG